MKKKIVSIVVAMDSKRGIGKKNGLLFKIPEDFARMKKLTFGHPIIMGRRTFESIGRLLLGRTNIVITSDEKGFLTSHPEFISGSEMLKQVQHDNVQVRNDKDVRNAVVAGSLEEAIEVAKKSLGNDEIIIFGGGQIFKEAIEKGLVDRLCLTVVEGDYGADTFFPDYSKYKEIKREEKSDKNYKYSFVELIR